MLFYVFNHRTFVQIVSFINSSVQIFLKLNSYKFFNYFQKQPPVPHKKSFFNKVVGLQAFNLIKKRLQHRYFLVIIRKFIRTTILKNFCKCLLLHFWKVFCKSIFQISKGNFWWNKNHHLLCKKLLKSVKIEQKCFLS